MSSALTFIAGASCGFAAAALLLDWLAARRRDGKDLGAAFKQAFDRAADRALAAFDEHTWQALRGRT